MLKKGFLLLSAAILLVSVNNIRAQVIDEDDKTKGNVNINVSSAEQVSPQKEANTQDLPNIDYSTSKTYEIADITVSGLKNPMYEDYVLISFSGLAIGDKIEIPGTDITSAIKRFWRQGLFADVKILASKIEGNKIWLDINLEERPRVSDIRFSGIKKGEIKDLEDQIGVVRNLQITPNQLDRAKQIVRKYFDNKGFNKAEINIIQVPDLSKENQVFLDIDVQKKHKTKVNTIRIAGNEQVSNTTLEKAMKKTRHKSTFIAWIRNFLRSTNYVPENYDEDKEHLIEKYNELGFRDASILTDTVYTDERKTSKVNIEIEVDEGKLYHIRDINWVGNTEYPTDQLQAVLGMKPGDVYNQSKLTKQLEVDESSVMNLFYRNNGYVFSQVDPVEKNIDNDSIDLEIRIVEGTQARFRNIIIAGNDRLYEDVVRRELMIKPGALYSQDDIMRSLREIMQMGHFDPESLQPNVAPDPEDGVVDVTLPLTSKANDQVEFSAGWGQTGIIGKLSLKFTNFSIKNLFNPSSYKGVLPQGEGQTLTLSAQTNGRYYQSYSLSFFDPWFGGKRPNSLSVSGYYSRQTDVYSRYANNYYPGSGYNDYYGSSYDPQNMGMAADPSKSIQIMGLAGGYGKRLSWPDDYFYFHAELSYQLYKMKNWEYFVVKDGSSNSVSLNLSLSRNSVDNPLYSRRGSEFSVGVEFTPPYSLWDGKEYKDMALTEDGYENPNKFKWIEYHKWKFKSKIFIPLSSSEKTPVLMTRAEFGYLGYYNKHKVSPFGSFYMGGDGMSGSGSMYATETIALRGYENGALANRASAYTRLALELRYPLILEPTSTIYLLTFVEAGNAWFRGSDINLFDLKRSAGVGARIILPMIGLMGIDWAYGFDAINGSRDNSKSQFHFVIGQEF